MSYAGSLQSQGSDDVSEDGDDCPAPAKSHGKGMKKVSSENSIKKAVVSDELLLLVASTLTEDTNMNKFGAILGHTEKHELPKGAGKTLKLFNEFLNSKSKEHKCLEGKQIGACLREWIKRLKKIAADEFVRRNNDATKGIGAANGSVSTLAQAAADMMTKFREVFSGELNEKGESVPSLRYNIPKKLAKEGLRFITADGSMVPSAKEIQDDGVKVVASKRESLKRKLAHDFGPDLPAEMTERVASFAATHPYKASSFDKLDDSEKTFFSMAASAMDFLKKKPDNKFQQEQHFSQMRLNTWKELEYAIRMRDSVSSEGDRAFFERQVLD